jgi:integrase
MPRPRKSIPSYRFYKPRNCGVVTIAGKRHYLPGAFDSEESRREYLRLVSEHETGAGEVVDSGDGFTVEELAVAYLHHSERYYRKAGRPTSQIHQVRQALKGLCALYGELEASEFGPLRLKALQQHWVSRGHSRVYCNKLAAVVKQAFRWGVSEELVPAAVHHGLSSVGGLKKGRTDARETEPVLPVSESVVNETIKHLSPIVAGMVSLQRLTGMRPGEVCLLRPCDVSLQLDGTAVYIPAEHKTEHHGRERRVYLGPKALDVLRPFLERDPDSYCFDPRESVAWHRQKRREARQTPLFPSHVKSIEGKRRANPRRTARERFTAGSYRRAVERAAAEAFPVPEDYTEAQAADWKRAHFWAPNQLRHLRATEIRAAFGIEAAQVSLGHSNLDQTQTYAERDFEKARAVALQIG